MGARHGSSNLQTILLSLFVCCFIGCARPLDDEQSRYRLTVRARGLLENGDPGSAATLLERVADAKPDAAAYVNLGLAHQARGHRKDANRAWRAALEIDPNSVRALFQLASSLHEQVLEDLQQAQGKPNKAGKLRARARARTTELEALLATAAGSDAFNASIPQFLATLHAERGDSTATQAALREAERLDPGRAGTDARVFGLERIELPKLRRAVRISRTPPHFLARPALARATFLEALDVNGDAREDLVLGGSGAIVGTSSEQVVSDAPVRAKPWLQRDVVRMQAGLFNADAHPDLVVFTPARTQFERRGAKLEVWFAPGGAQHARVESLGVVPYDVNDTASLDADADGDIDLVLAVSVAPGLRLWRNEGSGRFEPDAAMDGFANLAPALAVTSGDLDSDGRADLLWIDAQHQVRVLGARATGFTDASATTSLLGQRARAVACSDVDADGDLDILLGDDEGLWLWGNQGAARFERRAAYRETSSAWSAKAPRGVAVSALYMADLDNDGFEDAITLHFPDRLAEFAAAPSEGAIDEDTSPGARRLTPLLDVPTVSRLALWRNEGRGVFTDLGESSGVTGMWMLSVAPRAIDLDGDGDLDLACVGPDSLLRFLWNLDAPTQRRLEVELVHKQRPFACQGARVEVYGDTGARSAVLTGPVARIGVGYMTSADVLRVIWPDGQIENFFDVTFPDSYRLQITRDAAADS